MKGLKVGDIRISEGGIGVGDINTNKLSKVNIV